MTSATSHCGQLHTLPHERQERKFDQPLRLSSTIALPLCPAHLRERLRRLRVQALALLAHVQHLHRRQRTAVHAARKAQTLAARGGSPGAGVALPTSSSAPCCAARLAATSRAS